MALFLSPKQLVDIPSEFRSHPLRVKFTVASYDGLTPSSIPIVDEAKPDSYVAQWHISHELEFEPKNDEEETELAFEIISDHTGGVVGFGEAMIGAKSVGGTFREIVKIIDNHCGFKGTRLYVEIVQITRPPHFPKYLVIRVDHGFQFMEAVNCPVEPNTDIYISISDGERLIGTTKKQRGPTLVWMDSFEEEYKGQSSILLTGYGINKHGDTLDFGSARVNLWELLYKERNAKGEWLRHGELILSPDGNLIEKQSGKVGLTILFRDAYKTPLAVGAPAPAQYVKDADVPEIHNQEQDVDKRPSLLGAPEDHPKALSKNELDARAKAAKKYAHDAENAARAADRAAADADIAARVSPDSEKDDFAYGAEDAAKEARKNADDAASLARAIIDESDRRNPRVESLNKLNNQLQDHVNDAFDNRDRAEDFAKSAVKLTAEDLVEKAKAHFAKCADYASQTAKLADAFEDFPKLRKLADGAHNDQSTAHMATQDAKADAEACANAKTLQEAYDAMKNCEAMVRDVSDAENEARIKWKKANKLVQRQKKAKELQKQQELQKMQEEAEAEAIKKRDQRQRDHELDKAQRKAVNPHSDENMAWNYAAAHMSNGSAQTYRPNRGGLFRNFCGGAPLSYNTDVNIANSDNGKGYNRWNGNCCGGERFHHMAEDSTRAGDESQLEFDGYGMRPNFCGGQRRSFSGLEEKQYLVRTRRPPWCWCFGCQCCDCCGEC